MSRPILQLQKDAPAPQGPDVAQLHLRLLELGILLLTPQAEQERTAQVYGAETADAVREFQVERGLKCDGVVGPQTWHALEDRERTQPYVVPPDYAQMNVLEAEVLLVAYQEFGKGVREVPWASNRGPDVDRYLQWFDPPRPGYAGSPKYLTDPKDPTKGCMWCGLFAGACVAWACARLQKPDPRCTRCDGSGQIPPGGSVDCSCRGYNPIRHWGSGAWVPTWAARAKRDGCLATDHRPGQVALLGAPDDLKHLVLVASVDMKRGTFTTIEGNCEHGVRCRPRRLDEIGVSINLPMPAAWRTP